MPFKFKFDDEQRQLIEAQKKTTQFSLSELEHFHVLMPFMAQLIEVIQEKNPELLKSENVCFSFTMLLVIFENNKGYIRIPLDPNMVINDLSGLKQNLFFLMNNNALSHENADGEIITVKEQILLTLCELMDEEVTDIWSQLDKIVLQNQNQNAYDYLFFLVTVFNHLRQYLVNFCWLKGQEK